MTRFAVILAALFCGSSAVLADKPAAKKTSSTPKVTVYTGAKILTAAGKVYDPGTMIVAGGKIKQIGPAAVSCRIKHCHRNLRFCMEPEKIKEWPFLLCT